MSDVMPNDSLLDRFAKTIHLFWSVVRDVLHLGAYVAIASVLIYAFRNPSNVGNFINSLGVEHAEVAGLKFDFKRAATATSNASLQIEEILNAAKSLNTSIMDGATKSKIQSIAESAQQASDELRSLSSPVKKAVETQTRVEARAKTEPTLAGWMFLGRTNDAGDRWDTARETTPMPIGTDRGPQFKTDDTVRVNTDAYLRADGQAFALTSHPVIGVVPEGSFVRIKQLRPNPIRSGGKYLWAKVEVIS